MTLLPLSAPTFSVPVVPAREIGAHGELRWIGLDCLGIDTVYQRPVTSHGKQQIRRIAERFCWRKFSPLIVSPREGNLFAIIDGQHRVLGALLNGAIKEVPCFVLACAPGEEADAFAAINGTMTKMPVQYMFKARLASGDALALAVETAARDADVRILPYPVVKGDLKLGDTLSVTTIERCYTRFGGATLTDALSLITRTGDNRGLVVREIIEPFCAILDSAPRWRSHLKQAQSAIAEAGLGKLVAGATKKSAEGGAMRMHLETRVRALFAAKLGEAGTKVAAAKKVVVVKDAPSRAPAAPKPSRSHHRAFQITPAKAAVKGDERDAIQAFIAKNGVRKMDATATADPMLMLNYLQRRGIKIETAPKFTYLHAGKRIDFAGLVELVNRERRKDKLEPLTIGTPRRTPGVGRGSVRTG